MRNLLIILLLILIIIQKPKAQECPYKVRPLIDIPVTVGLGGTAFLGLAYLNRKPNLDSAYIAGLRPEDVNKFDRSATRQRNSSIGIYSDIGLYASFLSGPIILLSSNKLRTHFWTTGLIYLQTMMVMANVYTYTLGTVDRTRPYLYNTSLPIEDKLVSHSRNSFFAGHPAAAAASTFAVAKIIHDYNPGAKWRKFVWAGAFIPPAFIAYCRYIDGQHFPSDIIVGIPLGAAIGIVIPQLHKISNKNLSFFPAPGGLGMVGRF